MRVEVTFEMDIPTKDVDGKPISPTYAQVRQWLDFELGYCGVLLAGNPLHTNSLEPDTVEVEFIETDEEEDNG